MNVHVYLDLISNIKMPSEYHVKLSSISFSIGLYSTHTYSSSFIHTLVLLSQHLHATHRYLTPPPAYLMPGVLFISPSPALPRYGIEGCRGGGEWEWCAVVWCGAADVGMLMVGLLRRENRGERDERVTSDRRRRSRKR